MSDYVAGFMFDDAFENVALIRKSKPEWQAGKLNGIGGKIEFGETPDMAMQREFSEETGTDTLLSQWHHYADVRGPDWSVAFFATKGELSKLKSPEEEQVTIVPVWQIDPNRIDVIENLPWLIAMAIDHLQDGRPKFAIVEYP